MEVRYSGLESIVKKIEHNMTYKENIQMRAFIIIIKKIKYEHIYVLRLNWLFLGKT